MKNIMLRTIFGIAACLGIITNPQNSFASTTGPNASVLSLPSQLNLKTKIVAWDADNNNQIHNGTKNVGVELFITNDSPHITYIMIRNSYTDSTGHYSPSSLTLGNNITTTLKNGGQSTISTSNSFQGLATNLFDPRNGDVLKETVQPFSSIRIPLGSYPVGNVTTSLPLDIGVGLPLGIYADSAFSTNNIYNFNLSANEVVYTPST